MDTRRHSNGLCPYPFGYQPFDAACGRVMEALLATKDLATAKVLKLFLWISRGGDLTISINGVGSDQRT